MAGISANTLVPLMLIMACTAMLVPAGQAQIPGLLSPMPELQKCWAALAGTQGCLIEIYTYFMSGQIGKIGSVCCATIAQVSKECWPKMFPINPLFPPLLKTACAAPSTNSPVANAAMSKVSFPGTAKVTDIEGCVSETYKSLLNIGIIGRIGRDCCKCH
ncbi:hypothetical protein LWI28_018658 [Acer negundo]|uniref:Prolamin-like domain-containing protein n=1 Tax=Acer negundo TaxID=4023 RepID=A0AAD5JB69_ACENE|nr:hypothetical protein LWI28_018658 [Acer negundo]